MLMRCISLMMLCCMAASQGSFTHNVPATIVAGSTVRITATNWDSAVYGSVQYKCLLDGGLYASISTAITISDAGEAVVDVIIPNMAVITTLKIEADVIEKSGAIHKAVVTADPLSAFTADVGSELPQCITAEKAKTDTSQQILGMLTCTQVAVIKNVLSADKVPALADFVEIITTASGTTAGLSTMDAGNIISAVTVFLVAEEARVAQGDVNVAMLKAASTLLNLASTTRGYVTPEARLAAYRSTVLIQGGIRLQENNFDNTDKSIAASVVTKLARTWSNVVSTTLPVTNQVNFVGFIRTACSKQKITTNSSVAIGLDDTAFSTQLRFTEPGEFDITICIGFSARNPLTAASNTGLISVVIDTQAVVLTQPVVVSTIIPRRFNGYSTSSQTRNWQGTQWEGACKSIEGSLTVSSQCSQAQNTFPLIVEHAITSTNTITERTRTKVSKDTAIYVVIIAALVLVALALVCCCQMERKSIKREGIAYHDRHVQIDAAKYKGPEPEEIRELEYEDVPPNGQFIEQRKDIVYNDYGEIEEEAWEDYAGFISFYGQQMGDQRWNEARRYTRNIPAPVPLETEYDQYNAEGAAWAGNEGEWAEEEWQEEQWDEEQWQQ